MAPVLRRDRGGGPVKNQLAIVAAVAIALAFSPSVAQPIVYGTEVVHVPSDPTIGSGYVARVGTLGVRDGTATLYIKTTIANTGWQRIDGVGGGTGDITAVAVTDPACPAGQFMTNLTGGATSGSAPVGGTCTVLPVSGGTATSESVSATISSTTLPASINLSTEGTVDWLGFISSASEPHKDSYGIRHAKITGGYLGDSFVFKQGTASIATLTQASSNPGTTITTTQTDSLANAALNSTNFYGFTCSACAVGNTGFVVRAPCKPSIAGAASRRLSIYMEDFHYTCTLTVRSSDGTLTPVTDSFSSSGGTTGKLWRVDYAGDEGASIHVTMLCDSATTNPNWKIGGLTLKDL